MAARLRWSGALVSRPPAGCGADVLDARELFGELWGALPHGCEALWTGGTLFSGGLDRPDRVEFMSHPLPTLHGSRRRWRRVGDD